MSGPRSDVDGGAGGSTDPHLELCGLGKEYPGGITAVEDLSVSLPRGELLVLVGPSGCGKSTTLRCIAGLEEPTAGDLRIEGRSVVDDRPEERAIAMVFQNYALYPHKTARENIGFGLRMTTDLSAVEIRSRVEDVAGTLGITDLLDKKPKSLSGGQQQRVALGRAIVRDPEVFLLDEPLSNLDATLRARMRTEIQQLQRELDVTTVYVTHDQTEAMTIGDRVAVLRDGRLQQIGTPLECYHEPANRFVAEFVGEPSMNVFECTVDREAETVDGAIEYPLTGALGAAAADATGRDVVLGVRPEAVGLDGEGSRANRRDEGNGAGTPDRDSNGAGGTVGTFPGRVDVVEPVGERTFLYVTLDAGSEVVIAVPGGVPVGERERTTVRIPASNCHLFDAETGETLHNPERRPDATPGARAMNAGGDE
jgi:multiple sugar transport system ATP-binding protein